SSALGIVDRRVALVGERIEVGVLEAVRVVARVAQVRSAACYNTMDTYVTTLTQDPVQGLFMLPLTQKPNFYGTTSQLSQAAVSPDANDAGPLVNVVDYVFAS
ncbi:MAG: hypothetical protein AAFY28_07075, partial [Actinomycetota bacterium]